MSNRPIGGGSAFGGAPRYSGRETTGAGTRDNPYRASTRRGQGDTRTARQRRADYVRARNTAIVGAYEAERRGEVVPEQQYVVTVDNKQMLADRGFAMRAQELSAQSPVMAREVVRSDADASFSRFMNIQRETGSYGMARRAVLSNPEYADRLSRRNVVVPAPYSGSALGFQEQPLPAASTPKEFIKPVRKFTPGMGRSAGSHDITGYVDVRTGAPANLPSNYQAGVGVWTRSGWYNPVAGERWNEALGRGILGGAAKEIRTDPLRTGVLMGGAYGAGAAVGVGVSKVAVSTFARSAGFKVVSGGVSALGVASSTGLYGNVLAGSAAVDPQGFGRSMVYAVPAGLGFDKGFKTFIPEKRVVGVDRSFASERNIVMRKGTKGGFGRDVRLLVKTDSGLRGSRVRVERGQELVRAQSRWLFSRDNGIQSSGRIASEPLASTKFMSSKYLSGKVVSVRVPSTKFAMGAVAPNKLVTHSYYVGELRSTIVPADKGLGVFKSRYAYGTVARATGKGGYESSTAFFGRGASGGWHVGIDKGVFAPAKVHGAKNMFLNQGSVQSFGRGLRVSEVRSYRGVYSRPLGVDGRPMKSFYKGVFEMGRGTAAGIGQVRSPRVDARVSGVFGSRQARLSLTRTVPKPRVLSQPRMPQVTFPRVSGIVSPRPSGVFALASLGISSAASASTMFRSLSRPLQAPAYRYAPLSRVGFSPRTVTTPGLSSAPRLISSPRLDVSPRLAQSPRQTTIPRLTTTTKQSSAPRLITPTPLRPMPSTPPLPPPMMPMVGLPMFGVGGGNEGKDKSRRRFRYESSLIGLFSSARVRRAPKLFTGLEVRPRLG